jgi:hypothetical protein
LTPKADLLHTQKKPRDRLVIVVRFVRAAAIALASASIEPPVKVILFALRPPCNLL